MQAGSAELGLRL